MITKSIYLAENGFYRIDFVGEVPSMEDVQQQLNNLACFMNMKNSERKNIRADVAFFSTHLEIKITDEHALRLLARSLLGYT